MDTSFSIASVTVVGDCVEVEVGSIRKGGEWSGSLFIIHKLGDRFEFDFLYWNIIKSKIKDWRKK